MTNMPDESYREVVVESRFQRLARRPGGIPRSEAISRAQSKVEDMQPDIEGWLEGELHAVHTIVAAALAGNPPPKWIVEAAKHARQVRNVGTTIGFEILSCVADILCDLLDAAASAQTCDMDAVKCCMDSLKLAHRPEFRRVRPDQVPELMNGLRAVVARRQAVPA